MYLGHSFLAFALVAWTGHLLEADRRRVFVLAGLAAGFGLLPDVDVWRTGIVFLLSGPENVFPTEQYVWQHSWVVHRALTHSVVTGGVLAVTCGLVVRGLDDGSTRRQVATGSGIAAAVGGLLFVAARSAGIPGVVTMALFVGGGVGLAVAAHRQGATAGGVTAVAGVGLLTHPLGELWMGQPPAVLAPVVADPPLAGMALSPDPVLHFLAAVGVEVLLLWACLAAVCLRFERRPFGYCSPLALAGVGAVVLLGRVPAPTFAEAYQFSTGLFVLSLGVAVAASRLRWRDGLARRRAFVSGVAAFGVGLAGYAVAYPLFG